MAAMSPINAQVFELALGRILRMGSRPEQPGDAAEYARCRALCFDAAEGVCDLTDHLPNYARDHKKGAQGD